MNRPPRHKGKAKWPFPGMGLRLYLFTTCAIVVYDFWQDSLLVADFGSQNNDTPITASTIDRKQHFSNPPLTSQPQSRLASVLGLLENRSPRAKRE